MTKDGQIYVNYMSKRIIRNDRTRYRKEGKKLRYGRTEIPNRQKYEETDNG